MSGTTRTLRFGLLAASLWLAAISSAFAQTYMPIPPNSVIGNVQGQSGPAYAITFSELAAQLGRTGLLVQAPTLATICAAHQWLNTISVGGVPACAQPSFGDISGQTTFAQFPTGSLDQAIGYFGSTTAGVLSITNCASALIYSTSSHTFGCNSTAGTVTEQKNTAGAGLTTSGNCDNTSTNASSPCQYALALTNATLQTTPSNPTGTTSGTGVMMGLGSTCKITPSYSGRVQIFFSGVGSNNTASDAWILLVKFGTGAAPVNAAAPTGTNIGAGTAGTSAIASAALPFGGIGGIITGQAIGTQIWFDIDLQAAVGGTASVSSLTCTAMEF
jgi:hypothetical protein